MSAEYACTFCSPSLAMSEKYWIRTKIPRQQTKIRPKTRWGDSKLIGLVLFLFVCLFVAFRPTREFFTYIGEGLQILTYVLHSWPLKSEGSLACHTFCDTRYPFIMGHLRGPVTLAPIAYLFLRLRSVAAEIRTHNIQLAKQTL